MEVKNLPRLALPTIILVFAILLTSCANISNNPGSNVSADFQESKLIKESTLLEKIESANSFFSIDNGFVFFGRETCSTCRSFLPILSDVISDKNIKVYYFDTGYFREETLLTESELQKIFSDYKVLSVPVIIKLRDGQLYDTFTPRFNEQKDNTVEVKESTGKFLSN